MGIAPRELARELGFDPLADLIKYGYNPNEPRVPAGNHCLSGEWSQGGASGSTLFEGRSAGVGAHISTVPGNREHYKTITDLPKDAVAVKRRDGSFIDDFHSTTGFLMAPPYANYNRVYASGTQTNPTDLSAIINSVAQEGVFGYQRDATNKVFYDAYSKLRRRSLPGRRWFAQSIGHHDITDLCIF